jgi:hypothetical protein
LAAWVMFESTELPSPVTTVPSLVRMKDQFRSDIELFIPLRAFLRAIL